MQGVNLSRTSSHSPHSQCCVAHTPYVKPAPSSTSMLFFFFAPFPIVEGRPQSDTPAATHLLQEVLFFLQRSVIKKLHRPEVKTRSPDTEAIVYRPVTRSYSMQLFYRPEGVAHGGTAVSLGRGTSGQRQRGFPMSYKSVTQPCVVQATRDYAHRSRSRATSPARLAESPPARVASPPPRSQSTRWRV